MSIGSDTRSRLALNRPQESILADHQKPVWGKGLQSARGTERKLCIETENITDFEVLCFGGELPAVTAGSD
jgi:hypothetical protein